MKEVNCYFQGFNDSENRLDYLKYGLLNEYGYNLTGSNKETYNEEKIIKKNCNPKTK